MGITVTAPQAATAVTAALDTAAGVIVATGTSDAIEAETGRNPIRDGLMGGSQAGYDTVKGVTHAAAGYGIAVGMPPLAAQQYAESSLFSFFLPLPSRFIVYSFPPSLTLRS